MKSKRIIRIFFVLLTLIGFISIPISKADIGTYEKRTNPSNPFILNMDMIYYSDMFSINGRETLYNKVFLFTERIYLIYILTGLFTIYEPILDFRYEDHSYEDYYSLWVDINRTIGEEYILYKPRYTGYYNLTLILGEDGHMSGSSMNIGILEVPTFSLEEEIRYDDYWDFHSDFLTIGKINLIGGLYTVKSIEGGINRYYLDLELYCIQKNEIWGIHGDYNRITDIQEDAENYLIDSSEEATTFLSSGEYIFYAPHYSGFGISKGKYSDNAISGFMIEIIIALISVISIIVSAIFLIIQRRTNKK